MRIMLGILFVALLFLFATSSCSLFEGASTKVRACQDLCGGVDYVLRMQAGDCFCREARRDASNFYPESTVQPQYRDDDKKDNLQ